MIELHCHVDGLLGPALRRRLGGTHDPSPEALEAVVPVRSFDAWTRYAALVEPAHLPWQRMLPIVEAHVDDLAAQGVTYAELMVSRLLGPAGERDDPAGVVGRFRAMREAVDRGARGRLTVGLLAAVGRGPRAKLERHVARILEVARAGLVVGVAIAGDESACTIASIADLVARLRDAGLGVEIHAGEFAGPESVRDALDHGKPDRLGHGVRAFEDPGLVDRIGESGVHLELCPTSNLRLGVIPRIEAHPIGRARELGLRCSISTDDPGPFGCTLASEHALVRGAFGLDDADFEAMRADAWAARFTR